MKQYKIEEKPVQYKYQLSHWKERDELDSVIEPFVKYNDYDSGILCVDMDGKYAVFTKGNKRKTTY